MHSPENLEVEQFSAASAAGSPQPAKHRRHKSFGPKWFRRLRRWLRLRLHFTKIIVALVVVLVVVSVGALVLVTDATSRINSTLGNLERVVTSIGSRVESGLTLDDFDRLRSSLSDVISTLSSVQRQVGLVRPVLRFDPGLQATFASMDITQQLARSANELLAGLQPALFFLMGRQDSDSAAAPISSGERLVELLRIGRPSFLNAQMFLDESSQLLADIDRSTLTTSALLLLEDLEVYHEQIRSIQSILMVSPDLLTSALGLDGDRSYLVLSQNSDEIRPSGGYVSTYGWLTVRRGRVIDYNYSPTTASSPNPPPDTLADRIEIPDWWINYAQPVYAAWDGSWSPDFPTTARMAMWFYNEGNNPHSPVDGVISIDIVAFEYILEALGQVTVADYNAVVHSGNFRDVVYDIRAFGEGDLPHKRFLAALYRQIFADWQATASDPEKSAAILSALLRAVQEKHIMLSLVDPNVNNAVSLLGWSGEQSDAIGRDYLMIVDSNLGNKSNSSIRRQVIYDADIQSDQSVASRTTVLYDYPASVASSDPAVNEEYHGRLDYNNLLQVFVPFNTTLIQTTGDILNESLINNATNSQIVGDVRVPFDTSVRVQFAYNTQGVVQSMGEFERYQLVIQKQPGMRAELVNVQVTLPPDAVVVSTSPEPVASYSIGRPILEFRFEMSSDQEIEVVFAEN